MGFKEWAGLGLLTAALVGVLAYAVLSPAQDTISLVEKQESEMQGYLDNGYTIIVQDLPATQLPEDWHRWVYVVNDETKTVAFTEYKPVRRVSRIFPFFMWS